MENTNKMVQVFSSSEFGQVRTVQIDGEPWLVGKDVAEALGYTDINHTIVDHVDEEDRVNSKTQGQIDPEFGQRGTWLINESGLYALVLSSKLPAAKKFKRWITSEVLPSIRKTGSYSAISMDSYMIADPVKRAEKWIEEQKAAAAVIAEKDSTIAMLAPKAEMADDLLDHDGLYKIGDVAKSLAIKEYGRNNLFRLLYRRRVLINSSQVYQTYVNRGYFKQIEQPYTDQRTGEKKIGTAVRATYSGIAYIKRLILNDIEAREAIELESSVKAN
jgi:prophage antirepressor-like protein